MPPSTIGGASGRSLLGSEKADPRPVLVDRHRIDLWHHYPGLPGDPGHGVAARQMHGGWGAMLSIHLGSRERALAVAGRLELFLRATSLGGTESLVEHRASVEPPTSPVAPDLLRLSIGLEDATDLWHDREQATRL